MNEIYDEIHFKLYLLSDSIKLLIICDILLTYAYVSGPDVCSVFTRL